MTVKNVTIGDKFQARNKRKDICTVVDFLEVKSMITGEVTKQTCICESVFMGQKIRSEVPFSTVVRNRIK